MAHAYIAVIGPSEATAAQAEMARVVGGLIARAGAVLVSGGLGGVMGASCEGASANGGTTLGLLPGRTRSEGNTFLSVSIATGLGEFRNGLVVAAADAVIAIGGGWGTLSEIALAMRAGKPVVALHSWQATAPTSIERSVAQADSPADAVRLALRSAASTPAAESP